MKNEKEILIDVFGEFDFKTLQMILKADAMNKIYFAMELYAKQKLNIHSVSGKQEICRCGNPSGTGNVHFKGDEELIYVCTDCGKRAEPPCEGQP